MLHDDPADDLAEHPAADRAEHATDDPADGLAEQPAERPARPHVYGATVDAHTRCAHYAGPTDIVAIKFRCCDRFYPCFQCHAEAESHPAAQWAPADWAERAILCGACGHTLTIQAYRSVSACPACGSAFNDGCRLHAHLYFQVPPPSL